jgi:hypothetical protein
LLDVLARRRLIDYTLYTCNDTMSVRAGVELLGDYPLNLVAVSGRVTMHVQHVQEAELETDLPVVRVEELRSPAVLELLEHGVVPGRERAEGRKG